MVNPNLAVIQQPRGETGGFQNLGEQLRAVAMHELHDRTDLRLLQVRSSAAGASEMVPTDGGFLVAPEFSREILRRAYLTGNIMSRCMNLPMERSSFKYPQFDETSRVAGSRLGGIQMEWEDEGANVKPAGLQSGNSTMKPTFLLSELTAKKLVGYIHVSGELDNDSSAFNTWATLAFSQELAYTLEDRIVNGTGAGQPLGIMNSPALITVAKAAGQATGTFVMTNVEAMLAAFWSASYHSDSAIWLYNQSVLPQLSALSTVVGTAGSESKVWQWRTAGDKFDRLAGIPAMQSEYCQALSTTGDVILCDLNRYLLATREIRNEVSIHVRFLSFENTFRFVLRVDGQPIDRSPVTPANGSTATSPFVALATR